MAVDFGNIILGDENPMDNPHKSQEDTTALHGDETTNLDNAPESNPPTNPPKTDTGGDEGNGDDHNDEPIKIGDTELTEGVELESPDGVLKYVNGQLLDDKGNVFKKAEEVREYIKQFNGTDEPEEEQLNLESFQKAVGVDVTDEKGKPIQFTDDAEGRIAYINKVFELKQKEASDIALNTYFANNPIVKQFSDYISAGGNPVEFGQVPDRTGIEFKPDDANQHKAIIRTAWRENNNRGDVEQYINYLETTGSLADTAKRELDGIKQRDAEYKRDIELKAEQNRREEQKSAQEYWNTIHGKINSGVIAGYRLPETITKEVNGQKLALTKQDFFNYVSRVNPKTHMTQYMQDLEDMSDDDYMNRELLDAYLHFSGGTYKDLINMAVREEEVKRLKLVARNAVKSNSTIRINKPTGSKVDRKDIIL